MSNFTFCWFVFGPLVMSGQLHESCIPLNVQIKPAKLTNVDRPSSGVDEMKDNDGSSSSFMTEDGFQLVETKQTKRDRAKSSVSSGTSTPGEVHVNKKYKSNVSHASVSASLNINDSLVNFVEPDSQDLGQQNPWSVQYSARLWDQNSKNSSYLIKEAEKRVMRLADSTERTLMCTFNGISNINPNDFVANCHRTVACSTYINKEGVETYFSSNINSADGFYRVSSANSSNVAVITASNPYMYDKLLAAGQMQYLTFNSFTKEQKARGWLRIKSIKCPIVTIMVTGAEPENIDIITDALVAKYKAYGGVGTSVLPVQKKAKYEYLREGKLCCDVELSGEIQLTIQLPPNTDKEMPTGPISVNLGEKGVRDNLNAFQFGVTKLCKICGKGGTCFNGRNGRCVNRCKYCGIVLGANHVEELCPKKQMRQ